MAPGLGPPAALSFTLALQTLGWHRSGLVHYQDSQCRQVFSSSTSSYLRLSFFLICVSAHTCSQRVHMHTPTLPPAANASVNMSIVWPAHQVLIHERLQAAEGKELKVSVCEAFTYTHRLPGCKTMATFYGIRPEWQLWARHSPRRLCVYEHAQAWRLQITWHGN